MRRPTSIFLWLCISLCALFYTRPAASQGKPDHLLRNRKAVDSPVQMDVEAPAGPADPVAYIPASKGARVFEADRVEGQAVLARPERKWAAPAIGLRIGLFDQKHAPVATVVTGENGEFQIKGVAPGVYTLVVGANTMRTLSVPVRVRSERGRNVAEPALLLTIRLNTDRRNSVASRIADRALRDELLQRVEKDQAIRNEWIRHGADHPDKEIQARWVAIDAENLARLKEIVRQYGWPGPALVGIDGTEAAFLLLQHGDHEFQKEMLPVVRKAYRAGRLTGQDYALLLDRVLVRDGKPQVYGTQSLPLDKWQNREPAFFPIADEAHVDQRRAQLGLMSQKEYSQALKEAYFPQEKDRP